MTKLPEPEGRICFDGGDWEEDFVSSQDAYSEDQMLQFRRDALDGAALVCDALAQKASSSIAKSAFKVSANEIRTRKEQIQ
jgi:hypothetical protein